jgi:hypothetical protein
MYDFKWSRNSLVDIGRAYGLDRRGLIPGKGKRYFQIHRLKAGSTANQASYPMNSGGYFQVDKAAEL